MMGSGFSKVNPSTFFIYQITNSSIEGILDNVIFVMNYPEVENTAF